MGQHRLRRVQQLTVGCAVINVGGRLLLNELCRSGEAVHGRKVRVDAGGGRRRHRRAQLVFLAYAARAFQHSIEAARRHRRQVGRLRVLHSGCRVIHLENDLWTFRFRCQISVLTVKFLNYFNLSSFDNCAVQFFSGHLGLIAAGECDKTESLFRGKVNEN